MKYTKKALAILMAFAIISVCTITSYAYMISQYATAAPAGITGEWVDSAVDTDIATPTSEARGDSINMRIKSGTLKSLSTSFASNNGRTLEIWAMEDDPGNVNYDEHFKTYKGEFTGRALTNVTRVNIDIPGSVESHASVELYLRQRVGKINGDTTSNYKTLYSFYFDTY